MADNVTITSGTGETIATDQVGGAQHQYVKLEFGADGTATPVSAVNPLPISSPAIAITSLPPLGAAIVSISAGSAITISNLATTALTVSGTTIAITSLPPLGAAIVSISAGTSISVSGLTSAIVSISAGSIISVSGLTSASVSISNGDIRITSLPALGLGSAVTVSNGAIISISPGAIVSVSGGSIISVSGLTSAIVSLSAGSAVTISNLASVPLTVSGTTIAIMPHSGYFSFTSTYTSAQTAVVLRSESNVSTSAYHITDFIMSNENTAGNISLVESRPNAALRPLVARLYFTTTAGASKGLRTPIVLDTNSSLCMTSRSVTNHSITIVGYSA